MDDAIENLDLSTTMCRMAGRLGAQEVVELLGSDFESPQYAEGLIRELQKLAGLDSPDDNPQKLAPLARLESATMPFGEHYGKPFGEVPLSYLDWLCRSQESFYADLRAYLTHPENHRRLEDE